MKLRPLNDYILVKSISKEEVTSSGIILPDTVDKERPEHGEVVAVGPGKMLETGSRAPIDVQVGQKVMFKKFAPDPVKVEGEEYLVIRNDDIVAVIE